jgi:hypothetical protein
MAISTRVPATIELPSYLPTPEEPPRDTVEAIREGLPAEALSWLKGEAGTDR